MHTDVQALVAHLLDETKTILGDQFVGFYLHGSLAWGDFNPASSDVDFLVVTEGPLSAPVVNALHAMHARIAASDLAWRTNYEGSYIPRLALRRHDPADAIHPAVRVNGTFGLDRHDSTWVIQRHILRERGIVLAGPAAETLIDPVSAEDLRQAVRGTLAGWWAEHIADPFRLKESDYQAFAVLTMCRALFTLEHGSVASKPQAAAWAKGRLGARWTDLIEAALSWRHGAEFAHFTETLELVRETVAVARGWPRSTAPLATQP